MSPPYEVSQAQEKYYDFLAQEYGLSGEDAHKFIQQVQTNPVASMLYKNHEAYKQKVKDAMEQLKNEIQDKQFEQHVTITPHSIRSTIDKKIKELGL